MSEAGWQAEISDYKRQLVETAATDPNFAGFKVDFGTRSLWIYGVGRPSEALASMIAMGHEKVRPRWESVPYSRRDIDIAQDRLWAVVPNAVDMTNHDDYSGVVVGISGPPLDEATQQRLHAVAARVTDIPVTFASSQGVSVRLFEPS